MIAHAPPGISFVIRAHNEEQHLPACLQSLTGLTIPFEVVAVLNRCTDNSRQIVESSGLPVRIYEYDHPISRAGFETLVTPSEHPSSMAALSNVAFGHARYAWAMRWDADFVASDGLVAALNGLSDWPVPTAVRIACRLGDHPNRELYLSNCLVRHTRHVFWEAPVFAPACWEQSWGDDAYIQSLPVSHVKDYWNDEPWFLQPESYDSELASRYHSLVEILGPEPPGMARASNPVCDDYYRRVHALGIADGFDGD